MPSTMRERLLAAAAVRTAPVRVGDETFYVREVSADNKYAELIKSDPGAAIVYLLHQCVVDEDAKPCLSLEDAQAIGSSARVSMPLVTAVLRLSGYVDAEGQAEKEPDAD